jgi:hypothetical protein
MFQGGPPPTDLAELVSLVSAQQSTMYSQQAEIKTVSRRVNLVNKKRIIKTLFSCNHFQCDAESNYLEQQYFTNSQQHLPPTTSTSSLPGGGLVYHHHQQPGGGGGQPPNQIEVVLSEVRRLEDVAHRNEEELTVLSSENRHSRLQQGDHQMAQDDCIQSEISQLKARLVGTDQELQKTNSTLR